MLGMPGKAWRSFEEAREFARSLGLSSQREWHAYCKSDERPTDVPTNPNLVYRSEFKGYANWLGIEREQRSFEEAREFARSLGLRSQREWQEYSKLGQRPDDIPSNPDKAYGSKFRGYGDWLG